MLRMPLVLALATSCVVACSDNTPVDVEPVVRPVKILTVGAATDMGVLELPGAVSAVREAVIAFEVPGRITEIIPREGELVSEGDVLARLDPRDYEASRDSALARRNAARADYDRYVEARKANAVTDQDVDLARRTLDVAQAELNSAMKAVEDTVIRSPFDGRVANKIVDTFENVQAKQAVFEIHDESGLEVSVNVAERDWARGAPDLTTEDATRLLRPEIELSAFPGRSFPARAQSFATAIDPVTRTYKATFAFDAPVELNVTPGMTANVRVHRPVAESGLSVAEITLPASAVFGNSDGDASVWLVEDDMRVTQRAVELGDMVGGALSITSGLEPGDSIAVSGVHTLVEGMAVRPLEP